jgi:hypothetical protein
MSVYNESTPQNKEIKMSKLTTTQTVMYTTAVTRLLLEERQKYALTWDQLQEFADEDPDFCVKAWKESGYLEIFGPFCDLPSQDDWILQSNYDIICLVIDILKANA